MTQDIRLWCYRGAFDVEGFKKTLQLRAEIEAGGNGSAPEAEKYYDLSYYRMAPSRIK